MPGSMPQGSSGMAKLMDDHIDLAFGVVANVDSWLAEQWSREPTALAELLRRALSPPEGRLEALHVLRFAPVQLVALLVPEVIDWANSYRTHALAVAVLLRLDPTVRDILVAPEIARVLNTSRVGYDEYFFMGSVATRLSMRDTLEEIVERGLATGDASIHEAVADMID